MTFIISAVCPEVSIREPVGSSADIRTRTDEGSDMAKAMLWSFYHIFGTRKHFCKFANYNVMLITERDMIYSGTVWYIIYISPLR